MLVFGLCALKKPKLVGAEIIALETVCEVLEVVSKPPLEPKLGVGPD